VKLVLIALDQVFCVLVLFDYMRHLLNKGVCAINIPWLVM